MSLPEESKRKRAAAKKENNAQAQKKRKVEHAGNKQKTRKAIAIDNLAWKAVELPDRLDDAEGFFGLEEIDDVEVIKTGAKGDVIYKAPETKERKGSDKDADNGDDAFDEEEEWGGIDEDKSTAQPEAAIMKGSDGISKDGSATTYEEKKNKEKKDKKDKKKDKKQQQGQTETGKKEGDSKSDGLSSGVSFTALDDEVDNEDVEIDVSAWEALGLSSDILTAVTRAKFSKPTRIQVATIPEIINGHDVVGKAATGSGKTLAFGIPILEHLLHNSSSKDVKTNEKFPTALILSPTRELAHQIGKHISSLSEHMPSSNARVATITGGLSLQKQQRLLAEADIVVGTPGRLWEILSTGQGLIQKLKQIKFLVVDEADRLLSEGHFKEVEDILTALDKEEINEDQNEDDENSQEEYKGSNRQTLVFSATFHKGLQQKLAGKSKFMKGDLLDPNESMAYLIKKLNFREEKPKFIDVNPISQMAERLKEGLVECAAMEKDLYLYTLLLYHPNHRTLVFTNSISAVRRLVPFLQNLNLPALALHSNMPQKARLRSVERFSNPDQLGSILVATDVAARGLDIKGIELVLHYHVPRTADMYVHRSGRTARAEKSGKSILICAPDETVGVTRLLAKIHASRKDAVSKKDMALQTLDLDRRVISRIKPRVTLAKKISDTTIAKEKHHSEDDWLRAAADELGVDYDSEEFAEQGSKHAGRGGTRKKQQREAATQVSKAEMAAAKAELRELLKKRINVGVSERYLTDGRVDVDALLKGADNKDFLGSIDGLDF